MGISEVSDRVRKVITGYVTASCQSCPELVPSTKLVRDTGLSSDDGVNVVLDLCIEFNAEIPEDFNATVHDDGQRDRTFGELVDRIHSMVCAQE
ncbi:hypothetical protein Mal64_06340 [Pseudobythopirellula maris]|uniref:Acyl carrier protein n=1 Tax=Pseudobythopirellula maris TaxID=2527991 RepID=A0A5C5ZSL8_9BACT|nr:hypothetical protein Mal64_06340 [Pseudobythopirellula maris]